MNKYCRICINEVTDDDYKDLDSCNLPLLMQLYLPELITIVAEPCVCLKCFSILQLYHNLRQNALKAEGRIEEYAEANFERKYFTIADVLERNTTETAGPCKNKQEAKSINHSDEEMSFSIEETLVKDDTEMEVKIKHEETSSGDESSDYYVKVPLKGSMK